MASRHFPVRPNFDQLKHQAKDLLRAIRQGDPSAIEELRKHHRKPISPAKAKLTDAQFALARSYGIPNWPRLVAACRMTDAIWRGDVDTIRELILKNPRLLHEDARGVKGNWGPPMSYAANLGQDGIVQMLHEFGAADLQHAFERACLQGKLDTARRLHAIGARPVSGSVMGPCETLSGSGLELLLQLGAAWSDNQGDRSAPVAMILETYSRNPGGKHRCLQLAVEQGTDLPDTPPMAVHRGRIDLLERHLRRDPHLLTRTFLHGDIYPRELGCHVDESLALHGTPLAGASLLHLCVDYDEIEMARWLLDRGADVNVKAELDTEGFGGHTPLFSCVVSQPYRVGLRGDGEFARLLLDHGADLNARASLRKQLRFVEDESIHEYRNVTPLAWGEQFHDQDWVSKPVMRLIAERGGHI
ncbi:MAG: ankyrin repeat domain-containing protein [Acidobacteriaceae bacterium]|nr:ankyrin repeat domain-containing protein [Acidobacteriaceae bacterium]MBV9308041.1 ankyrin repeat domain-containing protein [Acidobacteriaceae bacterium]